MQVKLTNIETEISITPQKIADWFWEMSANEQSDFFAHLQSKGTAFEFQMAAVNSIGDIKALKNMEIIGTYGINCGIYIEAAEEKRQERIDQIKDIAMMAKNGANINTSLEEIIKLTTSHL
jgi:hypothetical protein